ncbi:MAG TPA: hypothetical protein VL463_32980 [Kofleriaceae bacterium]|nr:hypothetical protein [Kofleriaceae bacterium]
MLLAGVAHADARGVLRLGVEPLSLEPSADTPILGGFFDDAVTAYNAASAAYNRAHDVMTLAPINRSALGVHATMVTFAPGLEVGGEHAVFRMEALIGLSDTHRAIGIGVYPLDLAWPMKTITPYAAAGGTASWLDRTDVDGEIGGLVTLRAAAGVRVGDRVSVEIGYGMYVAGGIVDSAKLHSMAHYDPNGAPPPPADHAVAGGEQSGMIDVSLGVRM